MGEEFIKELDSEVSSGSLVGFDRRLLEAITYNPEWTIRQCWEMTEADLALHPPTEAPKLIQL